MTTKQSNWIGIKVSSISQRQKPNLPGRPARGVIIETAIRNTSFGKSQWVKVQWTDAEGFSWQDWSPISDFVLPFPFDDEGHVCGDRTEV